MAKKNRPVINVEQIRKDLILKTEILNNEASLLLSRRNLGLSSGPDPRRDLDAECGYPKVLGIYDYARMYEREGVACRVVNIFPDECFAVEPAVYESESEALTPFEEDWKSLCDSENTNPLHYLHRVDCDSGLGQFGVLMYGLPGDPKDPAPGVGKDGRQSAAPVKAQELRYLRSFDQQHVTVVDTEEDKSNPRYGHPKTYRLNFGEFRSTSDAGVETTSEEDILVHWTRIQHVADNRKNSEVYGIPRMRPVYNKLLDVQKILGSSGEMFYKGGFPGLSLELDPRILDALNVEGVDEDSVKEEMFNYQNGLQRYIYVSGLNVKSLAPQVANPSPALEVQLNSIAMSVGAPLRIFMGSEQAQLASGQDVRTWNRRIAKRQNRYLTPMLIRPMIDRLIMLGVLRPPAKKDPKTGRYLYTVWWPDVNMPDEDMKSQIGDRRASMMMKYFTSGAWQAMQFRDFLRFVMLLDPQEVTEVMDNAKKPKEIKIQMVQQKAADSGTKGGSPSKPPKGGAQ